MPSIVQKALKDTAVYWARPTPDGFPNGGSFPDPVEIKCRWIDLLGEREAEHRGRILVDRVVENGGFLWLGELSDLIPANATEYLPPSPARLSDEMLAYWTFDDTFADEESGGADWTQGLGSGSYVAAANGNGYETDNSTPAAFSTIANVNWNGANNATVAGWFKLTPDGDGDGWIRLVSSKIDLYLHDDKIVVDLGATEPEFALSSGWASSFAHVAVTLQSGQVPKVYVGGVEISLTANSATFGGGLVDSIAGLSVGGPAVNGLPSGGFDDLRFYTQALSARDIQILAAVHPSLYSDAEEIKVFESGKNIRGSRRVNKVLLID